MAAVHSSVHLVFVAKIKTRAACGHGSHVSDVPHVRLRSLTPRDTWLAKALIRTTGTERLGVLSRTPVESPLHFPRRIITLVRIAAVTQGNN